MTDFSSFEIQRQKRLPLKVAFGIVIQGIRIRFGRSLVTISGVMFGVAFLMSILTTRLIQDGVREEDGLRSEVQRMRNLFSAELGTLAGRSWTLALGAAPTEVEKRFLEAMLKEGVVPTQMLELPGADSEVWASLMDIVSVPDSDTVMETPTVILAGLPGDSLNVPIPMGGVLAFTRPMDREDMGLTPDGVRRVSLGLELSPEARERLEAESRREQMRFRWILVISMLVTLIGITNAMLMSVTERFREIGTMKCLGALSSFIRRIFILESSLMGLVGGVAGALLGMLFTLFVYGLQYSPGLVFASLSPGPVLLAFLASLAAGVVFSVLAALYPAQVASRMVPATALRSNI